MNLLLTLEAIKFYKVKHERLVQIGFVLLYLINIAPYLLPFCDPDFTAFLAGADAFMKNPAGPLPVFSAGNWNMILMTAIAATINLFVIFGYATMMVGEQDSRSGREIAQGFLVGLPRLLLFLVLMIVPMLLSSLLFMIPVLFVVANLYLLPLLLLADRRKLAEGLQDSVKATKGFRMMILLQMFFMSILLSLPESLVLNFLPATLVTSYLVPTFFIVLQTFAQGRLMAMFYLFLVKKVPVMIPSKPQL